MSQYRIKDHAPPHYIGGRIVVGGDTVTLPEGVKAGAWLEPVVEPVAEPVVEPAGKAKKKGRATAPSVPEAATIDATPVEPVDGEF